MVLALATPQAALDALDTSVRSLVYVDGVPFEHLAWDARFGVRETSTATITMELPRPAAIHENARIDIHAGHNDLVGPMFSGRVPGWDGAISDRGNLLTARAVGWSSLLAYRDRFDLVWEGPIRAQDLFDAACARRDVPSYRADAVVDPSGSIAIALGGNPQIDGGRVTIPAASTPLSWLRTASEPFGYRVYDAPDGTVRLSRVSGIPLGAPAIAFAEGVNVFGARSTHDTSGLVNYWDIHGPTYQDAYGATIPIRAFPASVPPNPLIPVNGGISYQPYTNALLVTQQLAEVVRQVHEIDTATAAAPVRWDGIAVPGIGPGDAVTVVSPTLRRRAGLTGFDDLFDQIAANIPVPYWITGIRMQYAPGSGLTATYEGWLGGSTSLPAGENRTAIPVQEGPVHLGNETLSHYAVPVPDAPIGGAYRRDWTVTIPERATAVNVRGWHHGTNSQVIGGEQTELEVTRWELWADPVNDERAIASGVMPAVAEELALRRPYAQFSEADPGFWVPFAINLSRVDPGSYTLRLVSGVKAGPDDFEVRLVSLDVWGIAEPVILPGEVS